MIAAEQDQRIDAVERRPAADIDQVQRRAGGAGEVLDEAVGEQAGDLLHAQAQSGTCGEAASRRSISES